MGRGNACTRGKYEGLYYVDYDNFDHEIEDEEGNTYTDYDFQRQELLRSLETFKSDMKIRFTSFTNCDDWLSREEHAILENFLFYVVIEDNESNIAIKLIQKEQEDYIQGNIEALQKRHSDNYLNGMRDCLFNQFETLGVYGCAWTSGTIKREDFIKKAS